MYTNPTARENNGDRTMIEQQYNDVKFELIDNNPSSNVGSQFYDPQTLFTQE